MRVAIRVRPPVQPAGHERGVCRAGAHRGAADHPRLQAVPVAETACSPLNDRRRNHEGKGGDRGLCVSFSGFHGWICVVSFFNAISPGAPPSTKIHSRDGLTHVRLSSDALAAEGAAMGVRRWWRRWRRWSHVHRRQRMHKHAPMADIRSDARTACPVSARVSKLLGVFG